MVVVEGVGAGAGAGQTTLQESRPGVLQEPGAPYVIPTHTPNTGIHTLWGEGG